MNEAYAPPRLDGESAMRIRLIGVVDLAPNHAGPMARGPREALAYLALNGSTTRERLASTLWPESDPEPALYNLRRALTALRKHLGPQAYRLDTSDRKLVRLDLTGLAVDLRQVREAAAAGFYEDLIPFCVGIPLDGISGEWAVPMRNAIRVELTQALVVAARATAGAQEVGEAEQYLRAALGQTGESRSVWQELIRLYADSGDLRAARRVLAECEASIAKSGGRAGRIDEPEETTGRFARLPSVLGELVGRRDVVAQLTADLESYRLVTLCGVGGLGKTRVSLEAAQRLEGAYPDGIAFIELAPATNRASVRHAIAQGLGIETNHGSPWSQALDWLARRQVLLVLDNAEHVVRETADAVTELLGRTSRLRILVTSRTPLGLPTERRRRLSPLKPEEARTLFTARASAASAEFLWSDESARLCEQLDGIPLAVELTAAQVGSVPLAELSASLARSLTLDSHCEARPERHQTMRAALQASFDALPPMSRDRLIELSVFAGGFSAEAAVGVVGASTPELARWTNVSLVEFDGARYRMLEPVRQLAAERLSSSGREDAVRESHARWYARLAREAYTGPFPYDVDPVQFAKDRKAWLRDEANLRAAIAWRDEIVPPFSDDTLALWLVRIWFRLIEHSSPLAQAWLPRLEAQHASNVESPLAAHWWLTVGLFSIWNDQAERGTELLLCLVGRCVEKGWLEVVAHAALQLAGTEIDDPIHGGRREALDVAVAIWEKEGNREQALYVRAQKAGAKRGASSGEEFWISLEALIREAKRYGAMRAEVIALRTLATRYPSWTDRLSVLERALAAQRAVGHWAEVHTLRAIGMAAREIGSAEEEIAAWKEAIRRGDEIGHLGTFAEAHLELGRAYFRGNLPGEAWNSLATSLRLIRSQERPGFLHLAIAHLADHVRGVGDEATAREIVAYLQRAAAGNVFGFKPKFEELHPGISTASVPDGPGLFANSDEIIDWVELRAALG